MSATKTERWVVRCDDYTSRGTYTSEAAANRAIEGIKDFGQCPLPHEAVRQ